MCACVMVVATSASGADPWADRVVAFDAGVDPAPGYDDPATSLGEPSRFTGVLGGFPGAVTPFNPAWDTDQIVSLGGDTSSLSAHVLARGILGFLRHPENPLRC